MTAGASLPYFTEDPTVPRRTGAVTAVAVIGIVFAALMIAAQAVGGLAAAGLPRNPGASGVDAAFAAGRFARVLFTLLMLLGCAGLLSLRPVARWLVVVSAYAWLVVFALETVTLVYALSIPSSGQVILRRTAAPVLAVTFLVSLAAGVAFPLFALLVLRQRAVAAAFAQQRGAPPDLPAVVRPVAAVLMGFAAMWMLQAAVEWFAVASRVPGAPFTFTGRSLSTAGRTPRPDTALVDGMVLILVNGTLVVGCGLLLARSRAGVTLVVIGCLVKMATAITTWGMSQALYVPPARGAGAGSLAMVYQWVTILSTQATTLLWPTLVLLLVTYRAADDAAAVSAQPPPPPPRPLPPPLHPGR